MTSPLFSLRLAVPALLGIGLAGLAAGSGLAGTDPAPIRCSIETKTERGLTALEGVLVADADLVGSYQFRVASASSAGRSTIQQGGPFAAAANQPTTLGKVTVNAGASLEIRFEVSANGRTFDCRQQIDPLR